MFDCVAGDLCPIQRIVLSRLTCLNRLLVSMLFQSQIPDISLSGTCEFFALKSAPLSPASRRKAVFVGLGCGFRSQGGYVLKLPHLLAAKKIEQ